MKPEGGLDDPCRSFPTQVISCFEILPVFIYLFMVHFKQ